MDVFGPVTPAQKGKAISDAFDNVLALLSANDDDDERRAAVRGEVISFVPEHWKDAAVFFADYAEDDYQQRAAELESPAADIADIETADSER